MRLVRSDAAPRGRCHRFVTVAQANGQAGWRRAQLQSDADSSGSTSVSPAAGSGNAVL